MAERTLELWLLRARWLMAPFYVGLVVALAALLFIFLEELVIEFSHLASMRPAHVVVVVLSLIDLSLLGNLILIVIFSGYESFVSKIDVGDGERPAWMGSIDFSGLKLKLMASLVAISGVVLMRVFMQMAQGEQLDDRTLAWLVGIHLTFVVSAILLAAMDLLMVKAKPH